jgi:hypothetical protein
MAGLNDEDPGSETVKRLAVELLRQRLKEFESFDWPPGLWDKYDFETALREAELGFETRALSATGRSHRGQEGRLAHCKAKSASGPITKD